MAYDNFRESESESDSDRESEVQPKSSANRRLSMELMGEGARVTSLTLAGGKLLVTIEAALENSKLTTAVAAVPPSKSSSGVIPLSPALLESASTAEAKPDSDAAKPLKKGTIVTVKPPFDSSFDGGRRKKESGRFFLEKNEPPLPPAPSVVPDPAESGDKQANGESAAAGTISEDTPFMVEDPGEGPDASGQSGLALPSFSVAGTQAEKSAPVAASLSLTERVPETIRLAGEADSGPAPVLEETKAKIEVKAPSPETGPSGAGATISLAPPPPPADGGMFEPQAGDRMIQDAPLPEATSPETGLSGAGATISLAPPLPPADGGMFEPQAGGRMIQDAPLPEMRESPKPDIEPAAESVPPTEPSIFQDEGSVIGGERHGEPRPSLSDWDSGAFSGKPAPASSESPFLSNAAMAPSFQPEDKAKAPGKAPSAPPPPPSAEEAPPPAPEQRKPENDARKESGATTILIRYTCPRCKTQGMQAVDKVGTVVTCSNCGKAMRLVMKK